MLTTLFLLAVSQLSPAAVETQPAAEDEAPITIRATGWARAQRDLTGPRARLMAERGAQVVAARNLLARLQELGVEPVSPRRGRVAGVLSGHRYSRATFLQDGTAMVTAEVTLTPRQARHYRLRYLTPVPSALVPTPTAAAQPESRPAQAASHPALLVP